MILKKQKYINTRLTPCDFDQNIKYNIKWKQKYINTRLTPCDFDENKNI